MKTLTWEEIDNDWAGLQKRHRMEIAQAVARYCVGHDIRDVARRLGQEQRWVQQRLDMVGAMQATGTPVTLVGGHRGVQEDIQRVIREYGPSQEEQQSEEFEPYVEHYTEQGHTEAAAKRLAKAEWAAESAIEAGVIKESTNKRNEKVNQILFPEDKRETWDIDFSMHMARVEAAARFLDEAKMNFLRRKATCERVTSVHEKWLIQVERVLNLHPTLNKD